MTTTTRWKDTEEQALARAIRVLRAWRDNTAEAAAVVLEVHERKLWAKDYSSFKEFCEKGCGISREWVRQLKLTAATVKELQGRQLVGTESEENKDILTNLTPKQRGELDGLPTAKKAEVLNRAIEEADGKSPPPKLIAQVREEVENEVKSNGNGKAAATIEVDKKGNPIVRDSLGYPIPPEAHEFWNRRSEIQELLTLVSRVKSAIKNGHEKSDPLYRAVHQGALDHLSRAYQFLTEAKPYAVCLYCQGHFELNNGCRNCYGTGLTSKHGYETVSDQGVRKIREAGLAKAKK